MPDYLKPPPKLAKRKSEEDLDGGRGKRVKERGNYNNEREEEELDESKDKETECGSGGEGKEVGLEHDTSEDEEVIRGMMEKMALDRLENERKWAEKSKTLMKEQGGIGREIRQRTRVYCCVCKVRTGHERAQPKNCGICGHEKCAVCLLRNTE
jgi:hypothetical protein